MRLWSEDLGPPTASRAPGVPTLSRAPAVPKVPKASRVPTLPTASKVPKACRGPNVSAVSRVPPMSMVPAVSTAPKASRVPKASQAPADDGSVDGGSVDGGSADGGSVGDGVRCRRTRHGDCVLVAVGGEIDLASVHFLRQELVAAFSVQPACSQQPTKIILDLAEVTFMDATGLGVLVGALRRACAGGGWIRLVAPSIQILKILTLTDLDGIFPIYDTAGEALAGARR